MIRLDCKPNCRASARTHELRCDISYSHLTGGVGAQSGGTSDRRESREYQLRVAMDKAAGMTLADYRVFNHLLVVANFATAEIPERFQPRSLVKLAQDCHVSGRQIKYSLDHLQRHGWLERHRAFSDTGIGGRGRATRYVLVLGRDCDCPSKKAGTECPVKEGNDCTVAERNRARAVAVAAGQTGDSAGRARGRGREDGESMTVEIAGETFDAIPCAGCSAPVPVKFAVDGRHAGCAG